jgi:elongation factor 1-alpha
MDNLKEEQERGVTIDLSHKKFVTEKYEFTVIDDGTVTPVST